MGLAPLVVAEVIRLIRQINEEGTTVLLAKQNAGQALRTVHRACLVGTGRIPLAGAAAASARDRRAAAAYLGGR